MPKSSFDPDAQAFITAAAITDNTQQNAINTLVLALKGYSIWTKFKAIYPIVGGTASQHKFNLKDPRDLDVAFRLAFATSVTHSSTGMVSNGTSGYANTYFNPFANASLNSHHLSYYSRTNVNLTQVEIGALSGALQDILQIRTAGTTSYIINQTAPYASAADTDSRAFYLGNRTASNVVNGWKNGVKVATATTSSTGLINLNIYLLAYNNGIPALYSTKECAFASIGDGLTDTEAANFYTAVNAYQVALSRNI